MATKIEVMSKLRPKIQPQGVVDLETIAKRRSVGSVHDEFSLHGIARGLVHEIIKALKAGETVKVDGLVLLQPSMKVGGEVRLVVKGDRGFISDLNSPTLWTADKVSNYGNMRKTAVQLIAQWNQENPDNMVE